jgi:L-ascorbate metabolism protein UlaG (beta-lactamase superfamily)
MHPFSALKVPAGAVGIHWFEQNAFALKSSRGTTLLTDPYFPHSRPAEWFIRPTPPLDEADLPVDYVLVTHAHGDHTNPETIARIHQAWPDVVYIGPEESIAQIQEAGVSPEKTIVINAGESISLPDVTVHAFLSKPPQGDPEAGIAPPGALHLGYVIEMEGHRIYCSGDLINNFADHDELIAPIAALKPDLGLLTTHPTEGEFPFFEGSVSMAQKLGLTTAVPSHYACFAKRTYDPREWAVLFPPGGPKPLIIPWNSQIIYS